MAKKSTIIWSAIIIFIILFSIPLRFFHLNYSEFQDDEKKAQIRLSQKQDIYDFFMNQRKGPVQFVVTSAVNKVTNGDFDEKTLRSPFTILNLASVVVIFLFVKKITNNFYAGIFAAFFYSVNGFVVAFSRIAQYQSLNLFFSFLSLYFYSSLITDKRRIVLKSVFATALICLSILSHWDAIFYFPVILYIFLKYISDKTIQLKDKQKLLILNLITGFVILLPFLIPYVNNIYKSTANVEYFNRRVTLNSEYSFDRHLYILKLYNPYYFLEIILLLSFVSLIFIRKSWLFVIWALFNFIAIKYLMAKPGTHIYNYVVPAILLSSIGIAEITKRLPNLLKVLPIMVGLGVTSLLFYQSYMIFIDHSYEYPWVSKKLFNRDTLTYVDKEVLTFGFPHNRDWKYVAEIIDNDPENCTYITNEGKEISQIYVKSKYGKLPTRTCYYVVVVKQPFISTRTNYNFPEIRSRQAIYEFFANGQSSTKLYKISRADKESIQKDDTITSE